MKKLFGVLLMGMLAVNCVGCNTEDKNAAAMNETESVTENVTENNVNTVKMNDVDYSQYFGDIQGCSVFYNYDDNSYDIYNSEKSNTRYSPCSTFKIISTLEGLENGVVTSEESKMNYSGYQYDMDIWNKDVNLKEAFQNSCVWYYRQVIDEVGKDKISADLEKLGYGNCDVSQWEGSDINSTPDTNGFWLESSLKISPVESVNVLADIFEGNTDYSENNIQILKNIMTTDHEGFYGKTGAGNSDNAWYVGFYENAGKRIYFAVHLDGSNGEEPSGAFAREIAYNIISNCYNG